MTDDAFRYAFAGVNVASRMLMPELPVGLPALLPRYWIGEDARLRLPSQPPDSRHDWRDPTLGVTLSTMCWGNARYLMAPGVVMARLDDEGRAVFRPVEGVDASTLRHTLLDQILPRMLAGDGALMAHAAAVVGGRGRALTLMGDTGYGKSTLCAALVRGGAQLLNDDCLRIEVSRERARAIPTYPGIRLRPDSLSVLYGNDLPDTWLVIASLGKRRVAAPIVADAPAALPRAAADIGAIVVLQPPGDADMAITLKPMAPAAACMAIVQNSFALDPTDMAWVRAQLARAAALVNAVPVYSFGYPRDYTRLPEVIARLRELML